MMKDIQYYITPPHRCSYLDDRSARMVFIDPQQPVDGLTLSELSRQGFRRSGDFIYRPECHHCRQCLSARVPVALFSPNSSQRRALKHNQDLRIESRPTRQATDVHYRLYERYISERHYDGDMYPPSREQFDKFLVESCANSFFLEFWLADQLLCVATCDELDDGVSAVYTFFDPHLTARSLGTFAILMQIEWAKSRHLPHVYLGYWVPESPKMRYKAQFSPLDILLDGQWQRLLRPLDGAETQHLIQTLSRAENISDYRKLR
ncbi:MAG: hypothetical protein RLY58_2356 [Pseudomonadota bacterium]|jgi:arginyl-tRNA--protein-N-Asp/Glu arginylyltransferase